MNKWIFCEYWNARKHMPDLVQAVLGEGREFSRGLGSIPPGKIESESI